MANETIKKEEEIPFPKTQAEMGEYLKKAETGEYIKPAKAGEKWFQPMGMEDIGGETAIDLKNIQAPVPSTVTTSNGNIIDKSAGIADDYVSTKERLAKLEEDILTRQKTAFEKMKGLITERPTIDLATEMKKQYAKWGIPEYFEKLQEVSPQIASLQERLAKLDAQEMRAIGIIETRPGLGMDLQGKMVIEKQREFAIQRVGLSAELGAKAAIAEMYRGNIDLARSLVSDTVNALTYDIQQKRADVDALYEYYGDYLSTLDTATQREISQIRADLEKEEDTQREDYLAKLNLMTAAAGKGVDLGLTIQNIRDMSLEEVTEIYSEKVAAIVPEGATKTQTQIIAQINSAVDQYRLNPAGFRERFIESLVSTYGEGQRKYITDQTYALMPSIPGIPEIPALPTTKEHLVSLYGIDTLFAEAEKAGFTKGWFEPKESVVDKYTTQLLATINTWKDFGFTDEQIWNMLMGGKL